MGETVNALFGGKTKAQKAEQHRIAVERNRLKKLEDGQRKVRAGGGRGLLAYIEDGSQTFGGGRS